MTHHEISGLLADLTASPALAISAKKMGELIQALHPVAQRFNSTTPSRWLCKTGMLPRCRVEDRRTFPHRGDIQKLLNNF
jgi:hypothetical protein